MADHPKAKDQPPVLADEITSFNGQSLTADALGQRPVAQVLKVAVGADGTADEVSAARPFPVEEPGVFGYAAGTAAATVDVPALARLKRVSVLAGAGGAVTVTIGAGPVVMVPAGGSFDEQIPGRAVGADVAIAGDVESYYVGWVGT